MPADQPKQTTRPSDRLAMLSVAVLDSNPHAAELYKNMLQQLGFKDIHIVSDGFEGVQLIKKTPIALLLVDVELKLHQQSKKPSVPVSGIDLIRRLRHSPASPNPFLSVIMLLDGGHPEQISAAANAGVTESVCKPVEAGKLCASITEIVERPRLFVTAETYKGPCRRRNKEPLGAGVSERRKRTVCVIRYDERKDVMHDAG